MRSAAWLAVLVLLPAPTVPAAEASIRTIEHVVAPGETLWSIAGQRGVYADPYLWPVIYKFNRDQITDPRRIYPSQVLQIPVQIDDETRRAAHEETGAPE